MSIFDNFFRTKNVEINAMNNEVVETEKVEQIYHGKWGYYPVSYETYKKLRELKKWYYMTLHDLGRWIRWNRKTKYRIGAEPQYCHSFVIDKWQMREVVTKDGSVQVRWYPKTRIDHGICEAYELARIPKATAEEVKQLKLSEATINSLYVEVSKFFKKE